MAEAVEFWRDADLVAGRKYRIEMLGRVVEAIFRRKVRNQLGVTYYFKKNFMVNFLNEPVLSNPQYGNNSYIYAISPGEINTGVGPAVDVTDQFTTIAMMNAVGRAGDDFSPEKVTNAGHALHALYNESRALPHAVETGAAEPMAKASSREPEPFTKIPAPALRKVAGYLNASGGKKTRKRRRNRRQRTLTKKRSYRGSNPDRKR